jgi:hypothetical protein
MSGIPSSPVGSPNDLVPLVARRSRTHRKEYAMTAQSAVFNDDTYLVSLGYLAKKNGRFFVVTNDGVEASPKRTRELQEETFLALQALSAVEPASSVPEGQRANILFLIENGMVLALSDAVDSWQDLAVVPVRRSGNLAIAANLGNGEFRVRGAEGRETVVAELELAFWDRVGGGKTVAQVGAEVVSALDAIPGARPALDEWLASVDSTFDEYLTSVAIAFMRSMGLMRVMTVEPGAA